VVVLDVDSGEVLAMVNQPSYNPNDPGHDVDGMRNRAVTDVIEPGSVMKPIAMTSILENRIATPTTPVETSPGYTVISGHTIRDHNNYGLLDATGVITKSSNVGITQLALQLEPQQMWDTYSRFGFGEATGTGFPGESAGVLRSHRRWRRLEQATISYGYGISALMAMEFLRHRYRSRRPMQPLPMAVNCINPLLFRVPIIPPFLPLIPTSQMR